MSVNKSWKKTIYVFVSSIHQAPSMFQVLRIQKRKRHGWSLPSENSQFLAKIQLAHPCNSIMILFYSLGFELVKYQMNSAQYFLYIFKNLKAVISMEQKWTTPQSNMTFSVWEGDSINMLFLKYLLNYVESWIRIAPLVRL